MRALLLRGLAFAAVMLSFLAVAPDVLAQAQGPRPLAMPVEPITPTRIESLLATPNVVPMADYYRIDMPALTILNSK